MKTVMITKDQVIDKLHTSMDHQLKTLLSLITTPSIPIHQDLIYDGTSVKLNDITYAPMNTLSIQKGHIFLNKRGKPYTNEQSLRKTLNILLQQTFDTKEVSISSIQMLFKEKKKVLQRSDYEVSSQTLKPLNIMDLKVDAVIIRNIASYKLFVHEETDKMYPFMLIKFNDKILRYDLYRYIAQLPWFVRYKDEYRLPTVDHISRDSMDNSMCNLRYCTHSQNGFNKCRRNNTNTTYHCVSNQDVLTVNPKTPEDKNVYYKTMFWFTLLAQQHDNIPSNNTFISKYNKDHFDPKACKLDKYSWLDISNYVNDFITELKKIVSNQHLVYADTYEKTTHYHDETPLLNTMLNNQPHEIKINCFIRPKQYCALAADVCKLFMHGTFAHTNFLKNQEPILTIASCIDAIKSPVDVLNTYPCQPHDVYHEILGVTEEQVKGKVISYKATPDGYIEGNLIDCQQQEHITQYDVDERTYIIDTPRMVYKNNKK